MLQSLRVCGKTSNRNGALWSIHRLTERAILQRRNGK